MIKKSLLLLICILTVVAAQAQDTSNAVQMADAMRENGKIYVVVAVILAIFAGIIFYLVRLDRKISRLERTHS
jgi:CcmD family protein